jgi:hypothetical protein
MSVINVQVPELDHDKLMEKRYGSKVDARGKLERRIVANMIGHLERAGWAVSSVFDGDEDTDAQDMKAAMELVFNLDDAWVYFKKGSLIHPVRLILGNGVDVITDWRYAPDDVDGFNGAMEAFDAEQYA